MAAPFTSKTKGDRAPDLLAGISRQAWLANRANNALQRPAFIGSISIGTFIIAVVSLIVAPRMPSTPQRPLPAAPRPDTMSLAANIALGQSQMIGFDSALVVARHKLAAAPRPVYDSAAVDSVGRDSLNARISAIDELRTKAEQSPLPSSYRALAAVPELRGDPRIAALLDSLSEIERERDGVGAVGGVDPIFVALTSRANDIGRRISVLAGARIEQLRAQMSPRVDSAALAMAKPLVDTLSFVASRDSVARVVDSSRTELARLREVAVQLDARDEAERARQTPVAPTLAVLAAAFVLSGVVGFAFAFVGELRHPRVSDATETERVLHARVLANIEPLPASAERHRRAADRNAPRHLEPFGEGYQLTYLGLATAHPAQLGVTVTGDDAAVSAVVACNLAAVAADEARNAVILDLTANANASAALQSRRGPGISEVVRGDADWADATTAIAVGRGKTIDLIPRGTSAVTAQDAVAAIARDVPRFNRYYDAVFVLMDAAAACAQQAQLAERDLVYCARPGITTLSLLRTHLDAARANDAFLRGLVLWKLPHPHFAAEREGQAPHAPLPAVAAVNS